MGCVEITSHRVSGAPNTFHYVSYFIPHLEEQCCGAHYNRFRSAPICGHIYEPFAKLSHQAWQSALLLVLYYCEVKAIVESVARPLHTRKRANDNDDICLFLFIYISSMGQVVHCDVGVFFINSQKERVKVCYWNFYSTWKLSKFSFQEPFVGIFFCTSKFRDMHCVQKIYLHFIFYLKNTNQIISTIQLPQI